MSTSIFLQARLNSRRLPGKALLPLAGIPVLEHCMNALDCVQADHHVLLTSSDSEKYFRDIAFRKGWGIFVGSPDDVLDRFTLALQDFPAHFVLRATADNPLVSPGLADMALDMAIQGGIDYFRFHGLPLGSGVEIIRGTALSQAASEATRKYEREHVTPYLYRDNKDNLFSREIRPAPSIYTAPHIRITLDYREDYLFLTEIFDKIYQGYPIELDKLITHIEGRRKNAS